jgi:hypothetical protein
MKQKKKTAIFQLSCRTRFSWSDDHLSVSLRIMKERVLSASEFKAKCLACPGEIERFGELITITRRGRPVAVLGPAKLAGQKSPRNRWAHRGQIVDDIVNKDTSTLREVAGRE